ncbi:MULTISPECIES: recombinase family protein [unclassified Gemella]|uniref:recombinase family protein n=1 Tax=unclassified Gemella TaxID=2624949 RepID=UPI0010731BDC|nr:MULTISPECIES: recombinase family protein [unclassified Gemella]MBF0710677.1 recombinase family protein [Gemella sp. GL1.1]MBF0746344.1 recombinase family protein [Gemella sp. 19428wG2_WT2a]NYS28021.1 recombinase family protein [Gemella sp. GL1]TFU60128.1 hypothetical protein E4T67_01435 [Gemella sp. WT2a]
MIINEEESKYVEKIYELYLQGMGTWSIEKYLNKKYPNKNREKSWKERTITEILKNINYTGDLLLQKTYTDEDYKTRKNKGERDQYLIENHHPAIISKEKFEKVQKLI